MGMRRNMRLPDPPKMQVIGHLFPYFLGQKFWILWGEPLTKMLTLSIQKTIIRKYNMNIYNII